MLKYIFIIIFAPNSILAETWRCETSISNDGRGNINEQKIYTKYDNYYLKSSQFGDKKLSVFLENEKQIIISKSSLNQSLWVFLNKTNSTFIEKYLGLDDYEISRTEGLCTIL
jgi:hypothetical protein